VPALPNVPVQPGVFLYPLCPPPHGGAGERLPRVVGVTGSEATARGAAPLWGGRQADVAGLRVPLGVPRPIPARSCRFRLASVCLKVQRGRLPATASLVEPGASVTFLTVPSPADPLLQEERLVRRRTRRTSRALEGGFDLHSPSSIQCGMAMARTQ